MKHLQTRPASTEFLIGDCWADLGEDGRAEEAYRQATELRPELPEGWIGLCRLRMLNGDFDSASQVCNENERHFPQFDFTSQMAAQCHFFARRFEAAQKIYEGLVEKDPNGGGNFYGAISYQSALGWLDLAAGNKEKGERILDLALEREREQLMATPNHPEVLYRTAAIETSLGLKDSALDHLRAAAAAGWIDFRSLAFDPRFDALRRDPAFAKISESMATKVVSLRRSMPTDPSGKKKGTAK
jgi:tetratricopeptide (TPR) repeat protein